MEHKTLKISGISVSFPCKPYPSQLSMMDKVIKGIDRRLNCLLESPTGSGKSLALLCSSLAWQAEEKAKKEQEDAQIIEKGLCTCECHQEVPVPSKEISSPPIKEKAPTESNKELVELSQPAVPCIADDDEDFRSDIYCFNKTSAKSDNKNSRKHITISYEDDTVSETSKFESPCIPKEEMSTLSDGANCLKCSCSPENKPQRKIPKIYFGTRTHKQVAQIVRELRKTGYHEVKMTILGSREHTCIHPEVSRMKNKNDGCKDLLNGPGCPLKDRVQRYMSHDIIKHHGLNSGWDLEDLINMCRPKKVCPYFLSRGLKEDADLIICPYNYLVEPLIREAMQINLKGHIVIFDEAHNIEDSAREAASQTIPQDSISSAMSDIEILMESHNLADYSKLRHMLKNLDSFMNDNKDKLEQKDFNQSYKIWNGFYIVAQLETLGMGPKHFSDLKTALASIKRDAEERKEEALREGWKPDLVEMKTGTVNLIEQIFMVMDFLYRFDLKYVEDYRASLVHSVTYAPRHAEGQWLSTKNKGRGHMVPVDNFNLNFWCMNPGVAFSDFSETRSVILTSGTLSPLASFQSELGLEFKIQLEANHVIKDAQVWVGTLGQGPNGANLQAVFRNLETYAFQDELGNLVWRVCQTVPHGVLCFLPSYKVLEKLCNRWESTNLMDKIRQKKAVLCEPRGSDKVDFEHKMQQFYQAVNESDGSQANPDDGDGNGVNGAVMFAVCRGKVSEGLDFADNFARAVISVGIPYPNFKDVQVELKRKYNDEHCQSRSLLSGHAWYEIQAFRALNQALGRCIRHRNDWGALIIVDDRFVKNPQKYTQGLSKWVRNKIHSFDRFGRALTSLNEFVAVSKLREEENQASDVEKSILSPPLTPEPFYKCLPPPAREPLRKTHSPSNPNCLKNFSIFEPLPKRNTSHQGRDNGNGTNLTKPVTVTSLHNIAKQNSANGFKTVPSSSSPASSLKAGVEFGLTEDRAGTPRIAQTPKTMSDFLVPKLNAKPPKDIDASPSNLPQAKAFPSSSKGVYVLNKKGTLRIHTEVAAEGVSVQLVKIPRHLHSLYGGDLNIPVSNTQKFIYIINPPSALGSAPMARLVKTINQELVSQSNCDKSELNDESRPIEGHKSEMGEADKSTVPSKVTNESEITCQESVPIKTPLSASNQDSSFFEENLYTTEVEEELVTGIAQSDIEKIKTEDTVKHLKAEAVTEGNPFLKFCKLGRPRETVSDLIVKGSPEVGRPCSLQETPPYASPLLFSPDVEEQNDEPPGGEKSSLCTKKPLFKRKRQTDFEENRNPGENSSSAVPTPRKEELKDEKVPNVRITASKVFGEASDGNNSDFVADANEEKLVLKRKSRRRRSSSLRKGNEKKMKREDSFVVEDTAEVRQTTAFFSCRVCGSDVFEDGGVSDFVEQRAIPQFLFQDSEEEKSGCIFFKSSPEKSRLQPLTEGLPGSVLGSAVVKWSAQSAQVKGQVAFTGVRQSVSDLVRLCLADAVWLKKLLVICVVSLGLSLKYIEQEEICVQFLYCVQCLKRRLKDELVTPVPLGARVQLAAGSSARFKKGQLWLFLHAVEKLSSCC